MTKMKSKKMTKSTFAIIIMGIVMVAMLAFGGTFAYFTATATNKTGTVQTGTISIKSDNSTISFTKTGILPHESLLTGEEATAITYDTSAATRAQIVYFTIKVEIKNGTDNVDGATLVVTAPSLTNAVTLAGATDTEKTVAVLVAKDTNSVAMTGLQVSFDANAVNANGAGHKLMGATITLTISAKSIQAVQADGTEITSLTAENAATMLALIG